MRATVDATGRLVIPEEIRRQAGLRPGMQLEVRWHAGRIEIEPAAMRIRLEQRGQLLVAVPIDPVEALTVKTVEETRHGLANDRVRNS
jgi:AbrB family looped-hinge helix DNA binding protein